MNAPDPLRIGLDVARGEPVTLTVDGAAITAYPGESVAAAMLAAGLSTSRRSIGRGEPRGFFCGMGVCWECAVRIDGAGLRRACMARVHDGMQVRTGAGPEPGG